ncbi:MAG TPA: discoidin domain-containing protein [Spirochaetota bacterium]|nr:discoidin domain-containing protein [Spirochaetota bacterium]HNT09253.1 discoidin domain-containing protein [Spirochaetota bacterium]
MHSINVSRRAVHAGAIADSSGELDAKYSVKNIVRNEGSWRPAARPGAAYDFFTVDFGAEVPVNFVEIAPYPPARGAFPAAFRIEASDDNASWRVIHAEKNFALDADEASFLLSFPLATLRYLKVVIYHSGQEKTDAPEIARLSAGIAGVKAIVGPSSSEAHAPATLVSPAPGAYWESAINQNRATAVLDIDLGTSCNLAAMTLTAHGGSPCAFPEYFLLELSADNKLWTTIREEKNFTAEPKAKYRWDFPVTPARYARITATDVKLSQKHFGVRLAGVELFAVLPNTGHTHNISGLTLPASIFNPGIVRLARDGETAQGAAVQGNDSRLRDASTIFKGIVQLADHGSTEDLRAVQASDPRLAPATDGRHGTVRLAYDREVNPNAVVRSDDSRLSEATDSSYGIVKLCPDGVYSKMTVVTGNDSRLKSATTSSFGIVRLADDGETAQDCVITGADRRLRDASTLYRGIVELAENGEDAPNVAVQGNDKRLKDATTATKGIVELAENGEDAPNVAVQGNDKRLKDATTTAKGIVELAENGEDAPNVAVQGNDKRLKDASTTAKGIVELAENGEDAPNVAVQGNDRRLKDATESRPGILRFAKNLESAPLCAVQGNDHRLRDATTAYRGIVELAENGEYAPGVAVQGNDKRLKDASTTAKGIVELAEDGEDKAGIAVQGHDRRLKNATETTTGIVRFAGNGESASNAAVQGNDKRLKDATTTAKGIVELAENGEDAPNVAVQGNDKRLKDASTTAKGIVELAENGEDAPSVAVQGNDKRLKPASVGGPGIVSLAAHGETREGRAVQANDPRLSDARTPLPHDHDYARRRHDFSEHRGTIAIADKKNEPFIGLTPPPEGAGIISAKNITIDDGGVGVAGVALHPGESYGKSYGVVGHAQFVGMRGQSTGSAEASARGCGVMGLSRFGAGGVFASEHGYSLVVEGFGDIADYDDSARLAGDGRALYLRGSSDFNGRMSIINTQSGTPGNIVEMYEVDDVDYLSPGNLLVAGAAGGVLSRSRSRYDRAVIGIVAGNPLIILNGKGAKDKFYPVVLGGKAVCTVDARERPIKPGDLIVSSDTPGCGMAGTIDSFEKIGTVIGKALEGLESGMGSIMVYVVHL